MNQRESEISEGGWQLFGLLDEEVEPDNHSSSLDKFIEKTEHFASRIRRLFSALMGS